MALSVVQFARSLTAVTATGQSLPAIFSIAPTQNNLLVYASYNDSSFIGNVQSGWTRYNTVTGIAGASSYLYKVAGAGESTTQTALTTNTNGTHWPIACWEVTGFVKPFVSTFIIGASGHAVLPATVTSTIGSGVLGSATYPSNLILVHASISQGVSGSYTVSATPSGSITDFNGPPADPAWDGHILDIPSGLSPSESISYASSPANIVITMIELTPGPNAIFTGTLTPTAPANNTLSLSISETAASITPTSTESRQVSKVLLSSASYSGLIKNYITKKMTAAQAPAGAQGRATSFHTTLSSATSSFTGAFSRASSFHTNLSGSAMFSGTEVYNSIHIKAMTGALTFAGTRKSNIYTHLIAAQTSSGNQNKLLRTGFIASITPSALLYKGLFKKLSGVFTPTGAISHTYIQHKILSGSQTFTTSILHPVFFMFSIASSNGVNLRIHPGKIVSIANSSNTSVTPQYVPLFVALEAPVSSLLPDGTYSTVYSVQINPNFATQLTDMVSKSLYTPRYASAVQLQVYTGSTWVDVVLQPTPEEYALLVANYNTYINNASSLQTLNLSFSYRNDSITFVLAPTLQSRIFSEVQAILNDQSAIPFFANLTIISSRLPQDLFEDGSPLGIPA